MITLRYVVQCSSVGYNSGPVFIYTPCFLVRTSYIGKGAYTLTLPSTKDGGNLKLRMKKTEAEEPFNCRWSQTSDTYSKLVLNVPLFHLKRNVAEISKGKANIPPFFAPAA